METEMRKLLGAVVGLTITVLGVVSSNNVRAQDSPKVLPLDQTLMPGQTAVVMVDFQNSFASPEGAYYSLFEKQFRDSHMIENSLNLVKAARELGMLVIHVTEGYTNDYREVDMSNGAAFHRNATGQQVVLAYDPIPIADKTQQNIARVGRSQVSSCERRVA
jgi:Isochorismatase family